MERAHRQKQEEFERVAFVHMDALYSMALRFTRNPAEAEDLLQDTLVRAFRFFHRYEPGTNAKAWLFKILRNSFINRYRRSQKRPEQVDFAKIEAVFESLLDGTTRSRGVLGPEEEVLRRTLDEPVDAALRALAPEYRMVLLLAVVEGCSYKEIAAIMKCPIGTVMSRLHRARKHMQVSLLEYARARGLAPGRPGDGPAVRRRRPETG